MRVVEFRWTTDLRGIQMGEAIGHVLAEATNRGMHLSQMTTHVIGERDEQTPGPDVAWTEDWLERMVR